MEQYIVGGMSCAACQARVEKAVRELPGVESVAVSLLTNSMGVEGTAEEAAVIRAVEAAGYTARPRRAAADKQSAPDAEEDALKDRESPVLLRRLLFSLAFLMLLMYIGMGHGMWGWPLPSYFEHNHLGLSLSQMLLAAVVMLINGKFFSSGFKALLHRSPNMDSLVALGSGVSFGWSVFVFYKMCGLITEGASNMELMGLYHDQLYFESAAMIPALITLGKLLEALSKGRTTDALKSLMKLKPKTALLERDGCEREVPVEEVAVGDVFLLRPGDSVPVDGIVLEGSSALNEAALSGESLPVDKGPGDKVSEATINQSGFLKCRATRVGEDTTLAQIIRMVSDAAATKAPIARIADKVSAVFVPAVILLALLVSAGWLAAGRDLAYALERGICVLVISCPCALGLATPVAIMVGNGIGAKAGILFKTGEALETAGRIGTVVLDKTGTITAGEPKVTELLPTEGGAEEELLRTALALEQKSEHPLAKAVTAYAGERGISAEAAEDFSALPGRGVEGRQKGRLLKGGSTDWLAKELRQDPGLEKQCEELASRGRTLLLFAEEERFLGCIAVTDVPKPDSAEGIRQLKGLGLKTVMLTGDNERTAAAVAAECGLEEWVAGVLPEEKEGVIRSLQKEGRVAMVGDGINDAPALTRADVGIAIGAGTDVAIESADIVLENGSLKDVAAAIRLSRKTLKNIHENLFWAFFYNLICIPLAAGLFGWRMSPMLGAAAMSLSSFTVCMNALRLNLFDIKAAGRDRARKETKKRSTKMEKTVKIEGMMCAHCEASVKKALEALPFVESAEADHKAGEAKLILSGSYDEAAVKEAVEAKDYVFKD
ncbi:MAG: heavy metal translocating P-type ATPase [Lachnospiraceae bacterium]|nr:heavy metal translocating P-type ATPase [Lachnospiraceae bacterium]